MLHTLSGQLGDRSLALIGIHCILELYDCPAKLLDDVSLVQQALREAARRSNSTLLGELCHPFEPQGITALALLGESHISIHTWPEAGYAAVDVFTCGRHTRPEAACEYLIQVFQARRYSLRKLPRRTTDAAPIEEMADFPKALSCETAGRRR
ncbi:spermidine synthase [Synechococcus sp. 63AY4M2]|uniref:adenosylmethionine decarboxylase n=1 Tax=unclassified Synechococcus TaxID=2626047 RepID=UPI00006940D5|nr:MULTISPECIES: adenosylmethionine decarboxylase [unclassified Synechococcus]ABC98790.1 S-adenosylmethionine decarboxylase proenzyme [Synechococcus sp. JA-3-3Ab]PIK85756.1 spermidine synthase [Synechococcus sp. 63AY4M2]PIK91108.1 spermidine synthase [Synechococcus sp. 65AY6Li]